MIHVYICIYTWTTPHLTLGTSFELFKLGVVGFCTLMCCDNRTCVLVPRALCFKVSLLNQATVQAFQRDPCHHLEPSSLFIHSPVFLECFRYLDSSKNGFITIPPHEKNGRASGQIIYHQSNPKSSSVDFSWPKNPHIHYRSSPKLPQFPRNSQEIPMKSHHLCCPFPVPRPKNPASR